MHIGQIFAYHSFSFYYCSQIVFIVFVIENFPNVFPRCVLADRCFLPRIALKILSTVKPIGVFSRIWYTEIVVPSLLRTKAISDALRTTCAEH